VKTGQKERKGLIWGVAPHDFDPYKQNPPLQTKQQAPQNKGSLLFFNLTELGLAVIGHLLPTAPSIIYPFQN